MSVILVCIPLAALLWVGYLVSTGYASATGTPSERLWQAFRGSATMVLAKVEILYGSITDIVNELSTMLATPEIKTALDAYLPSKSVSGIFLALGVLTLLARARTLGKN